SPLLLLDRSIAERFGDQVPFANPRRAPIETKIMGATAVGLLTGLIGAAVAEAIPAASAASAGMAEGAALRAPLSKLLLTFPRMWHVLGRHVIRPVAGLAAAKSSYFFSNVTFGELIEM